MASHQMGRTMQHGTHLVLALLIAAALPAWAGFLKFEPQTIETNTLIAKRVAMYSSTDAPSTRAPGNGHSSLHLQLKMSAIASEAYTQSIFSDVDDTPRASVAILHADLFALIGNKDAVNGEPSFCCVQDLVGKVSGCDRTSQIGDLIIPSLTTAPPSAAPTDAPTNAPTASPTTVAPTTPVPTAAVPTTSPTANPTVAPTPAPTTAPTSLPTSPPTTAPATAPTSLPTLAPSSIPNATAAPPSAAPNGTAAPAAGTVARSPIRHLASAGGSGANAFWFGQIRFNGSQASDLLIPRELLGDFAVQMTGNHYVVVANCDPRIQTLNVAGPVVALNPFGFLPAELYGFLPFYAAMTLIYVTVTLGWLVLVMMHSDQLLPVQLHITGVLLLSLVEMLTWYLDYVNFNEVGERRAAPFLVGICAAVLRRTVSRMLVIAVSLGYGVVRSDLGKSRTRLLVFGALYLVLECALEIVTELSHSGHTEMQNQWQLMLTFPVAALDGIAYWWIFVSLSGLMQQLETRKQMHKLDLYHNFTRVLVVSLLICVAFASYQIYFVNNNSVEQPGQWQLVWLMDGGFWNVQYTLLLFAILFLWRPSPNARHYALAQELAGDDDEAANGDTSSSSNRASNGTQLGDDGDDDAHGDEDDEISIEMGGKQRRVGGGGGDAGSDDDELSGFSMQPSDANEGGSLVGSVLGFNDNGRASHRSASGADAASEADSAFDMDDDELSGPRVESAGQDGDEDDEHEVDDEHDEDGAVHGGVKLQLQARLQHARTKAAAAAVTVNSSPVASKMRISVAGAAPVRAAATSASGSHARAGSGSAILGAAMMSGASSGLTQAALSASENAKKMALREAALTRTK